MVDDYDSACTEASPYCRVRLVVKGLNKRVGTMPVEYEYNNERPVCFRTEQGVEGAREVKQTFCRSARGDSG